MANAPARKTTKKPTKKATPPISRSEVKTEGGAGDPAGAAQGFEAISVVGPKDGRRRAGRRFGPTPTIIPAAEVSDEEYASLENDPLLIVAYTEAPGDGED